MNDENNKCLEAIIEYNMPADEAKAFKLVCLYLDLARKFIPNYQHPRMPKGDPRRSELFRYCYKLTKETADKLEDGEYKFYIKAQFDILRNIVFADGNKPLISPSCLVGEKAWGRWLKWKQKYDKVVKFLDTKQQPQDQSNVPPIHLLKKDLDKLKHFFYVRFERHDKVDITKSLEDGSIFQWVSLGRVPVYYLLLSPLAKKWLHDKKLDLMEQYSIDTKPFIAYISPDLQAHFDSVFAYEY